MLHLNEQGDPQMLSLSRGPLLLIFLLLIAGPFYGKQARTVCQNMLYEHYNQVDYTIRVGSVSGVVKDIQGFEIRGACVGIFTVNDNKLVVLKGTDADGHFDIDGLPSGRYRLVVSANGLCAANAVIILKNK